MAIVSRRTALATATAFGGFWRATASAQPSPKGAPEIAGDVAKAALQPVADVSAQIEQQMQDWLASSSFAARNGKDLIVVMKTAPVQLPSSNPDWIKARTIAVADAYVRAQSDYIAAQTQTIGTETVRQFTKGPDVPPEYREVPRSAGAAAGIIRKILGVANGRLDQELRDLGIDPQTYATAPEAQQTELLRNRLKQTVTRRAFGAVAGMAPVMTFEGSNGAGDYEVGVLAVASNQMADFARQVLSARGQFAPDAAKAADVARFYANPAELVHQFGVRRCFDQQGLPVILSFSQWGSSYRGNDPAMAANYRDAARSQAIAQADGQIADFLKGSASFEASDTTGQEIARVASVLPDSTSEQITKEVSDTVREAFKRIASVQISGVRSLYTWTGRHPASATPILGVIRMWSAASEQTMRALSGAAAPRPSGQAPAGTTPPAGVTQSKQLMDASDF